MLRVGEASGTMMAIAQRQRGRPWIHYALVAVLAGAGSFAGANLWPSDAQLGTIVGGLAGVLVYYALSRRMTQARFRARMVEKGFAPELPLSMEIAPDALHYRIGDVRQTASWSAVSELFHNRQYWIFLVQSSPWFAPQRFFADTDAERAFIAEALSRMSEAARSRSAEAVAFSTPVALGNG